MTFIFIDPARRKKRKVQKSAESQAVLDALDEYLEGNIQEPVKWLARFWKDQAAVFTYRELLTLVTDESEPEKLFGTWFKDYSKLLAEKITPMWQSAFLAGANTNPIINGIGYQVNTSETSVREWILNRGAELITNVTEDQVNAVRYIIAESQANKMGSAETARYIRPTVGLTERQAAANLRLYNTTKEQLRADHPRMTDESIERKARAIAGRYAQSQQMTRAETIARTEVAFAYNQGNDTAIRQAMSQGLVPIMRKVWSTADDGHVCPACEDLEGTEIDMDSEFKVTVGKKVKRTLSVSIPPLHPRCKCAVMYEETGEYVQNPVENPQDDDTMNQEGDESQIPEEYVGNYDDFAEITLDQQERDQLSRLRELSDESGFEYGSVVFGSNNPEPFTSNSDQHVVVPEEYADQPGLRIFHAHTNDTPFSGKDFEWLTRENVEKISVIAGNGDVFVSYIGYGYRPDLEEYKEVLKEVMAEANMAVMDYPGFSEWSFEQRTYMAIREQAYLVARRFGWTLEGGRL
ncbi:MAG: hypothetical protein IJV14_02930 [Lachnospiraceae bacterium]|nr:hypothetical protein [Lachnospiraceae bacterium]